MARHNKILEHKTDCPECGKTWNRYVFQNMLHKKDQEQINFICDCETRVTIRENINGFLVMRKYIMKKDRVKRISK